MIWIFSKVAPRLSLPVSQDVLLAKNEFSAQSSGCTGPGVSGHATSLPTTADYPPGQHGAFSWSPKNKADSHLSPCASYHQCVHPHRPASRGPSPVLQRGSARRCSRATDPTKVSASGVLHLELKMLFENHVSKTVCRLQVVLLHGQAFTSKTWEELGTMALLATNGYQALAMDLPGTQTRLHLNTARSCIWLLVVFAV